VTFIFLREIPREELGGYSETGGGKICLVTGRAVVMRRMGLRIEYLGRKSRYSTPDDAGLSSQFCRDVSHPIDQSRVSLYVETMILWVLTR